MASVKKTVSIFVPKVAGEAPSLWVAINGKSWNIPRGKRVDVPEEVAAIVYRRERSMQVADEYSDKKQSEYDSAANKFT